jgi:hypothetical protein
MTPDVGRYSVVRFIEDVERREPLNVGVVLIFGGRVVQRFVEREELGENTDAVRRFAALLEHLFEETAEERGSADALLEELVYRRFGQFELTPPRIVEAAHARTERVLDDLVERLVASPVNSARLVSR